MYRFPCEFPPPPPRERGMLAACFTMRTSPFVLGDFQLEVQGVVELLRSVFCFLILFFFRKICGDTLESAATTRPS